MDVQQHTSAKLVLLGEMGSGKSSLVLRYVKGTYFDDLVSVCAKQCLVCWFVCSKGSSRLSGCIARRLCTPTCAGNTVAASAHTFLTHTLLSSHSSGCHSGSSVPHESHSRAGREV